MRLSLLSFHFYDHEGGGKAEVKEGKIFLAQSTEYRHRLKALTLALQ